MSFQNVGIYNAGVIGSKAPSPMGSLPVMDADGIATGGAFLISGIL